MCASRRSEGAIGSTLRASMAPQNRQICRGDDRKIDVWREMMRDAVKAIDPGCALRAVFAMRALT